MPNVPMRRLHGRAIERAYQTGDEPMVCTHHGEESYYSIEKTNVQPRGGKKMKCERCEGLGVLLRYPNTGLGVDDDNCYEVPCPVCKSKGEEDED